MWVSALRTCKIPEGPYYLEALETRPDRRRQGYGVRLLSEVLDAMKAEGPFRLCDCVGKKNTASLRAHEKCGFRIVSEKGYDYLHREVGPRRWARTWIISPAMLTAISSGVTARMGVPMGVCTRSMED